MKKNLFLFGVLAINSLFYSQFTTGTVILPTAGTTVKFDVDATKVKITLTGDSNSMLGIGFGISGMLSGADGFIYNTSANRDYTFGGIGITPSADVSQDWTELSNTVSGSTRTIVANRSLSGGSGDFAFSNAAGSIDIFYSRRAGNTNLGYHGSLRDYTTLTLSPTLATNENNLRNQVAVFPNPVKDFLNFSNIDQIKMLKIYDENGKLALSVKSLVEKMDVSKLSKGIYFLEIELKDGTAKFEKLIKQ